MTIPKRPVAADLAGSPGAGAVHSPFTFAHVLSHPAGTIAGRALILGGFLVCWQLGSGTILSAFWFSSPSAIAATLRGWVVDGSLWHHLGATLLATALGYLIGSAAGVATGLLLGLAPTVARVAAPFITALYSLPKIALAPVFVILFGIGLESKIMLVAVTVFFLLLYNTLDGIKDVDHDLGEALEVMGATPSELILKVLVPGTMPWIFAGLRIAVRYAFTATILGELIASNRGIGFLIDSSAGQFDASGVFAAVFVLIIVSLVLTETLTRIESLALPWRT
jgi:NitT/TauT family transport system permease protein